MTVDRKIEEKKKVPDFFFFLAPCNYIFSPLLFTVLVLK